MLLAVAGVVVGFGLRSLRRLSGGTPQPVAFASTGTDDPRLLRRLFNATLEHRLVAIAAGVAFYFLLSIFPGIAAVVSLYGLFADPVVIIGHVRGLQDLLPAAVIDVVVEAAERFAGQRNTTLGLTFTIGLLVSLWSANAAVKAMFDALNIVNGLSETRSIVALNLRSLAVTAGAILFFVVAIAMIVAIPMIIERLGLGSQPDLLLMLRWPALLMVSIAAFAAIYHVGPCRAPPDRRWITPGSTLAALLWMAGSMLFSWYVTTLGNYDETYGSIGAVVVFMTWSWVTTMIVLAGAELDAALRHRSASM
ncbi:MAG: YihY/virulence factor BrkB family protein [Alphaproteobacteria bacterium]|nr:YihY/virulence factor BrkB family protein [Alphaproteobacteria bacterium]